MQLLSFDIAKKSSRKASGKAYSTLELDSELYELMPGKDRMYKEILLKGTFIGRGAAGKVKLARGVNSGEIKAVKIYHNKNSALKEAKNMQVLNQACHVGYTEQGKGYLVRDVIPGIPFAQVLKNTCGTIKGHLNGPSKNTSTVIEQYLKAIKQFEKLVDALEALHYHGMAHQDLHFLNVLFDEQNDKIIIFDFDKSKAGVNLTMLEKFKSLGFGNLAQCINLYHHDFSKIIHQFIERSGLFDPSVLDKLDANTKDLIQSFMCNMLGFLKSTPENTFQGYKSTVGKIKSELSTMTMMLRLEKLKLPSVPKETNEQGLKLKYTNSI